jgi:hypothetical protein
VDTPRNIFPHKNLPRRLQDRSWWQKPRHTLLGRALEAFRAGQSGLGGAAHRRLTPTKHTAGPLTQIPNHHKNMKLIVLIAVTFFAIQVEASVFHIDISKISNDKKLIDRFEMIKDNARFYDHWTPEWKYEKSKIELVKFLEESFSNFENIKTNDIEVHLLLGTISHYLYNLEKTEYNEKVISNFSKAIKLNPKEFRAYWFLGFHHALSNNSSEAIKNLLVAKGMLPKDEPIDFWENYAYVTALANMPSNSIYAMDRIKELSGDIGYFEEQLGDNIRKRVKSIDKTKNYQNNEIWSANQGDVMTFLCRPLGIKMLVDSTWNISIHNYTNRQTAVILNPNPITNNNGRSINYSIAIIMKTVSPTENLGDFINNFVAKYETKKKITISDKYDKMIAYEITEKSMYQDIGGGHLYMIGIEREAPRYPGLLLEVPVEIPFGDSKKLSFYRANESLNRFEGRIFYAIMLDSCEDIHDKSFSVFLEFLNKYLILE